jgi:hypothetical protein
MVNFPIVHPADAPFILIKILCHIKFLPLIISISAICRERFVIKNSQCATYVQSDVNYCSRKESIDLLSTVKVLPTHLRLTFERFMSHSRDLFH